MSLQHMKKMGGRKRKRQDDDDEDGEEKGQSPSFKKKSIPSIEVRFRHPTRIIVAGPSGCGKTVLMSTMLKSENHDVFFDCPLEQIVWCYTAWQDAYDPLKAQGVIFHKGIPPKGFDSLFTKKAPPHKTNILVLDDLMREAACDKSILDIFSTHAHHSNITTFYLTQNVYHQGSHSVDITRNTTYIIMFLTLQNMLPLRHVLGGFLTKDKVNKVMDQIYRKTQGTPFNHVLIDMHPLTTNLNHTIRLNTMNNVIETIQIL